MTVLLAFALLRQDSKPEWFPLFNGKGNLTGWTAKVAGYSAGDNYGSTFRVEDGLIKVRYDQFEGTFGDRFGHLVSNRSYSSYRLRVTYRFLGEQCEGGAGWAWRNSGVMIHSQSAESMAKDQPFPVSIEVQFLGGDGTNERHNVNLCTPGTNVEMNGKLVTQHCTDSTSRTCQGDDWVTVEVEVRGGRSIRHYLDGARVLEYQHPQLDLTDQWAKPFAVGGLTVLDSGHVALQSESHPIDFKAVEIMPLDE